MRNPILESIRQTREKMLAESGGTLAGLVARLQTEEVESSRVILPVPQKPVSGLDWKPAEPQSSSSTR